MTHALPPPKIPYPDCLTDKTDPCRGYGELLRAWFADQQRIEKLERELTVTRQRCAALELLAKG